ncbi:hypothetical protein ABPG72_004043 [Tetrahymena utriculariae]
MFLHGLEGEMLKLKQYYLEKNFEKCITPYMKISRWNLFQQNSFPRELIRKKLNLQDAGYEYVQNCMQIQISALNKKKPEALVGISWGGGIGLLLLSQGKWQGPTVLMAPAITLFLEIVGERDFKIQDIYDKKKYIKLGQKASNCAWRQRFYNTLCQISRNCEKNLRFIAINNSKRKSLSKQYTLASNCIKINNL